MKRNNKNKKGNPREIADDSQSTYFAHQEIP